MVSLQVLLIANDNNHNHKHKAP